MKQINQNQKLYVIVRGDLSPGYQLVQSNHAIVEFSINFPKLTKRWHEESNYIASLSVNNEDDLLGLLQQCINQGIKCSLFREPDIEYQATAMVIEPSEEAKRLCSRLPLALKESSKSGRVVPTGRMPGCLTQEVAGSSPAAVTNN